MKIGFTGSQGTGKTTLAKSLLRDPEFKGYTFIPSTARRGGAEGFKVNREADPLSQLLTTVGRITAEYDAQSDKTISDRTPLDSLAYTTYQYNLVWEDFNSKYYWEVSYSLVTKHMEEYDHIFYFPPYWDPNADGLRDTDPGYQYAIDENILAFLEAMNVDYVTVPELTVPERVEFVKNIVCTNAINRIE